MEETILVYEGKILIDSNPISKFKISKNLTMILTNRLRGREARKGAPSSSRPSFREVLGKNLGKDANKGQLYHPKSKEYIVEQSKHSPCVELQEPTIYEHYKDYFERVIICRFNGLWPKT